MMKSFEVQKYGEVKVWDTLQGLEDMDTSEPELQNIEDLDGSDGEQVEGWEEWEEASDDEEVEWSDIEDQDGESDEEQDGQDCDIASEHIDNTTDITPKDTDIKPDETETKNGSKIEEIMPNTNIKRSNIALEKIMTDADFKKLRQFNIQKAAALASGQKMTKFNESDLESESEDDIGTDAEPY